MAMNLRDKGYSSSMDGYQKTEQKKEHAPVSALRAADLLPKPASTQKKADTTAQKKQTAAGIPVSAQRMNSAGNNRAVSASNQLTESEFNRAPAMQKRFGNYDNYLMGRRVTSSGLTSRPEAPQLLTQLGDRAEQYWQAHQFYADQANRALDAFNNGQKSLNEQKANAAGLTLPAQEVSRTRMELAYYNNARKAQKAYESYMDTMQSCESVYSTYQELDDQWWEKVPSLEDAQKEFDQAEQEIAGLNEALTKAQNDLAAYARMAGTPGSANKERIMGLILNKQDEMERIQKTIDEKREDMGLLQEQLEYARIKKWKGFAEQKVPDSAKRANEKGYDYHIVDAEYTGLQKAAEVAKGFSPLASLLTEGDYNAANLAQMYPEEKKTYQAIYENYGPEMAAQYLQELESMSLNTRRRMKEEQTVREIVRNRPVAGYLLNSLTTLASPLKAGEYLMQGIDMLDGKMTKDAGYNRVSYLSNAVRDEWGKIANEAADRVLKTEGSQAGSFVYQTYMSMADFMWNMALTGGFGVDKAGLAAYEAGERTAEAVNAYKAYKTAETLSLTLMGTQAAADAVLEAKDRGLEDGQAFALGTLAGAFEVLTEKVSIENLMEGIGNRSKLLYILKNVRCNEKRCLDNSPVVGHALIVVP